MSGEKVGYVRVSTLDQNTERQLEGIELDKRFEGKASGKDTGQHTHYLLTQLRWTADSRVQIGNYTAYRSAL
jgi:DNA invertase Pin-like site-specific DNA recombinase